MNAARIADCLLYLNIILQIRLTLRARSLKFSIVATEDAQGCEAEVISSRRLITGLLKYRRFFISVWFDYFTFCNIVW